MLADPLMAVATAEVMTFGNSKERIQAAQLTKKRAQEVIISKYESEQLPKEQVDSPFLKTDHTSSHGQLSCL